MDVNACITAISNYLDSCTKQSHLVVAALSEKQVKPLYILCTWLCSKQPEMLAWHQPGPAATSTDIPECVIYFRMLVKGQAESLVGKLCVKLVQGLSRCWRGVDRC